MRRQAMARAAGLVAGATVATVSAPAYSAETKEVLMGSDSGLLAFVPQKTSICKGDSVKWYVRDDHKGSCLLFVLHLTIVSIYSFVTIPLLFPPL